MLFTQSHKAKVAGTLLLPKHTLTPIPVLNAIKVKNSTRIPRSSQLQNLTNKTLCVVSGNNLELLCLTCMYIIV